MARQVAHDIKNPLTPIQLNAEHLRRVHADRGEPLGPILKECVETILSQVALLRQISSEFSNFASSPSVRRTPVEVAELLKDLVAPYERGLDRRLVDRGAADAGAAAGPDRPRARRPLAHQHHRERAARHAVGRRLTIEAATAGRQRRRSRSRTPGWAWIRRRSTRVFEPYFSTKARGTGLGPADREAQRRAERRHRSPSPASANAARRVEVRLPLAT